MPCGTQIDVLALRSGGNVELPIDVALKVHACNSGCCCSLHQAKGTGQILFSCPLLFQQYTFNLFKKRGQRQPMTLHYKQISDKSAIVTAKNVQYNKKLVDIQIIEVKSLLSQSV